MLRIVQGMFSIRTIALSPITRLSTHKLSFICGECKPFIVDVIFVILNFIGLSYLSTLNVEI